MSAPPFRLLYTREAEKVLNDLRATKQHTTKPKKIQKSLRLLQHAGPRHPGLHSHGYTSVPGPGGEQLWESYVENRTPSAWRIWWIYGPGDGQLTIVTIGPHP